MLKSLLSGEQCAKCRICCSFVRDDVWEAPDFTHEKLNKDSFKDDKEILLCPALDEHKGCTLGKDKPFDCSLWPLRPFLIDGHIKIGIAKVCPAFAENDYDKLKNLLADGLYDRICKEVNKNPSLIKNNPEGYTILT